jgi:Haem-NO-binding
MINHALQSHILTVSDEATWQRVVRRAGIEDAVFHSMTQYPDAVTYKLVGAASEELGVSAAAFLRGFGRHWVLVTAPGHYGALMTFAGTSFAEFLSNLDRMHDRVATMFHNLQQPSFEVEELGPSHLKLHYRSHRAGLAPFVEGLIDGLGERFGVRVEVTHGREGADSDEHDVFSIRYGAP